MLTAEIEHLLTAGKHVPTLLITIGNALRKDDGVGPYIARNITKKMPKNLIVLDAGDKPENIIDKAIQINPKKTIILDAANFKGQIGEARIIPDKYIPDTTLSTHRFPLNIVGGIIKEDTGSEMFYLGIQPEDTNLGSGLSPSVKNTADNIISCITKMGDPNA